MLYYSSFLVAMFAAIIMIPPLTYAYQKLGIFDMPSPRKVHKTPVPRVGGIAIVIASVIPVLVWMSINLRLLGILLGMTMLFVLGIFDDVKNLNYKTKFLFQTIAIVFVFTFGFIEISQAYYVSQGLIPGLLLAAIYLIFILGVTNAVNLADGLDGLAGGEVLLSFSIIGLLAYESSNIAVLTIVLAVMGAVFGFLRFNTYPARIFMGDTGSLFLGFMLGLLSVVLTYSDSTAYAKTLPLLLVGLPVFDTLMVIIVRLAHKQSPFSADRNHLHHRLLDRGLKHYQSVIVIYVVQGVYVLAAYFMRYQLDQSIVLAFVLISLAALLVGFVPWQQVLKSKPLHYLNVNVLAKIRTICSKYNSILFTLASLCVIGYALLAMWVPISVSADIFILLAGVAVIGLFFLTFLKSRPCNWIERVAIHVLIVLSIYLGIAYDQLGAAVFHSLQNIFIVTCFVLIALLLLSKDRQKFSGSPLDFLLVTIALIVPNLPGSPISEPDLSYLALKLIALFYCVEFLLFNLDRRWWVVRVVIITCASVPILLSAIA